MLKIDWNALREEWIAAPHGGKRAVIQNYAKTCNVSYATLYRGLQKRYGPTKDVIREKKVPDQIIDEVAKIKIAGEKLSLSPRELSTGLCIDILSKEGKIKDGDVTVSTVNRRLRGSGFRMENPVVRFECSRANQEHQMDFTRSKYFQMYKFSELDNDWLLKRSGKNLEYKEHDKKFRTWIVSLVDSYSRVRLSRAYPATNESAFLGLGFLHWVWTREEDAIPLRYLSDILKTDNGAFAKRTEVTAAFTSLGVDLRTSAPGNKDSQGKVERPFRTLWQRFELFLSVKMDRAGQETLLLREYNDLLLEYCAQEMQEAHPIHRLHTREALYRQSILQHAPRQFDGDIFDHAFRVEERQVGRDLMVKFRGENYEAPLYCLGKSIRVYQNMNGELMGDLIDDYREKPFLLTPYRVREYDDYENRPHGTYRQQMEKELRQEKQAKVKDTHDPAAAESQPAKQKFLPPRPIAAKAESVFTLNNSPETFKSPFEAQAYIGKQLPEGYTYQTFRHVFDDLLESTLEKKAIDAVLLAVKETLGDNNLKLIQGG
jgi:transposase InsO family protein